MNVPNFSLWVRCHSNMVCTPKRYKCILVSLSLTPTTPTPNLFEESVELTSPNWVVKVSFTASLRLWMADKATLDIINNHNICAFMIATCFFDLPAICCQLFPGE